MIKTAELNSAKSASYLKKLCHHFQIKVPVEFDDQQGNVQFPAGTCVMRVAGEKLVIEIEAEDEAGLAEIQYVLDSHIELFSKRDPLQIEWASDKLSDRYSES